MSKTKEINIFIENTYENFTLPLNLEKATKDAVEMVNRFLADKELVKKSCLKVYDFEE